MCRSDRLARVYIDEAADMAGRMGARITKTRTSVKIAYPDWVRRQKRLEKKREAAGVEA